MKIPRTKPAESCVFNKTFFREYRHLPITTTWKPAQPVAQFFIQY